MLNRHLALLTVFASIAAWSLANAADPPAGTTRDCTKIEDYKEMVVCYAANSRDADAEMTRVYEGVLKKIGSPVQRDLLISSQAAWVAYQAAYCSFVSSAVEGGSMQPTMRNACHAEITRIRIRELEHQLGCREGDLSCVIPGRQP